MEAMRYESACEVCFELCLRTSFTKKEAKCREIRNSLILFFLVVFYVILLSSYSQSQKWKHSVRHGWKTSWPWAIIFDFNTDYKMKRKIQPHCSFTNKSVIIICTKQDTSFNNLLILRITNQVWYQSINYNNVPQCTCDEL